MYPSYTTTYVAAPQQVTYAAPTMTVVPTAAPMTTYVNTPYGLQAQTNYVQTTPTVMAPSPVRLSISIIYYFQYYYGGLS